jgi:hypothetical protein
MPTYILKLWAHAPNAPVPTVEVEADDEMKAAALGLKHFAQIGKKLPGDGTIDVGEQPFKIEDVLRWLRITAEGQEFALRKDLTALLSTS